jgi:hypothetical protein
MSREYEVERFDVEGLTVRIVQDPDPQDPREDDNLGTMVCWHRRATLGDGGLYTRKGMEQFKFAEPQDYYRWKELTSEDGDPVAVELPLSLYEHGGMTMWAGRPGEGPPGTNCQWDSGQVGYIFVTRKKALADMGWKLLTMTRLQKLTEILTSEVKTYDQFLQGDIYGYVVEDVEGESLDSCWGFYGMEEVRSEGKGAAECILAEREKARKDEQEERDGA